MLTNDHYQCPFCGSKKKAFCEDDAHQWGYADASVVDQAQCDDWNHARFLNREDWTPHALWSRRCKACDKYEYKELPIDSTSPWGGE